MHFSADSKLVQPPIGKGGGGEAEPIWNLQKHTGRSSYPCCYPYLRPPFPEKYTGGAPTLLLLAFPPYWAGEPIWNLQKNTQVGAPTPTPTPTSPFFLGGGQMGG